jgi:hypothetical protein
LIKALAQQLDARPIFPAGSQGNRLNRLAAGGKNAADEAHLMVSEKVHAAAKAAATLMTGGSPSKVVRQYRKRVPANVARLSRLPKKKRRRSRRR